MGENDGGKQAGGTQWGRAGTSEDDQLRERFGPRGVPGAPDPAKVTPQREKKTPKHVDPGHTA
jgi:hypothetical protein